jgi:hypothetical protein
VHRIDQEAFGYLTTEILDPNPSNTAYMNSQFDKKLREFADLGGDAALRAAIERYVSEHAGLFAARDRAPLCHNDFHEGNILVVRGDAFAERLALYRLYHALELWDWFASLGRTAQLDSLAGDMRRIAVGG